MAPTNRILRGQGRNWFMKKTWSRKLRVRLPLKVCVHCAGSVAARGCGLCRKCFHLPRVPASSRQTTRFHNWRLKGKSREMIIPATSYLLRINLCFLSPVFSFFKVKIGPISKFGNIQVHSNRRGVQHMSHLSLCECKITCNYVCLRM